MNPWPGQEQGAYHSARKGYQFRNGILKDSCEIAILQKSTDFREYYVQISSQIFIWGDELRFVR